jgi:hypothetical protein
MYQATAHHPDIDTTTSSGKASSWVRNTALALLAVTLTVALSTGLTSIAQAKQEPGPTCEAKAILVDLIDGFSPDPDPNYCFGWAKIRHQSGDPSYSDSGRNTHCKSTVRKSKSLGSRSFFGFHEAVPGMSTHKVAEFAKHCAEHSRNTGAREGVFLMAHRNGVITRKMAGVRDRYAYPFLEAYDSGTSDVSAYRKMANANGWDLVFRANDPATPQGIRAECEAASKRHNGSAVFGIWAGTGGMPSSTQMNSIFEAMKQCNVALKGGSSSQKPNTQKPNTQKPNTQKPNTQKPNTQKPNTQKPVIHIDSAGREGAKIRVNGWAFDPDLASESLQIHAYLDNQFFNLGTARLLRHDVNVRFNIGGYHGFSFLIDTRRGGNLRLAALDLAGKDAGWSDTKQIGTYVGRPPIAVLDWAGRESSSKIRVRGWAFDPNLASESIEIHAYLNGRGVNLGAARNLRTDVNGHYNIGGHHGFDTTIDSESGGQLCLAAIDVSGDGPTWFACQNV